MAVDNLRQGKWWSVTGWLFILALVVRPAGGHHDSGHAQSDGHSHVPVPTQTHSHGSHVPVGLPTDAPTPGQQSPDQTQPCPCASSCSATKSGIAAAMAAPEDTGVPPLRLVLDARSTNNPLVPAIRFRLPLATAPPLLGM